MMMDGPVIDYGYDKKKDGKSMILSQDESDELQELVAEWEKDRQGESFVGKTFSLDDFMAGKV